MNNSETPTRQQSMERGQEQMSMESGRGQNTLNGTHQI